MIRNYLLSYVLPHNLSYVDRLGNIYFEVISVYILKLSNIISMDLANIFINLFWNEVVWLLPVCLCNAQQFLIVLNGKVYSCFEFALWTQTKHVRSSNSISAGTDTPMHFMTEWKYRDVHVLCSSAYIRFTKVYIKANPHTYIENAEWRITFWMNKISNGHSSKCWTPVRNCFATLTEYRWTISPN